MIDNVKPSRNKNTWVRFAYMLLFAFLVGAGRLVLFFVILGQAILVLFTGRDNDKLRDLGQGLGKWIYQCISFMTFNTESKPFPFADWPDLDPSSAYSAEQEDNMDSADVIELEDDADVPSFVVSDDDPADADGKK